MSQTSFVFRRGSVGLRVLAAVSVLVLAIVAFQVVYFPERQIAALTDALEVKALSLSRLMAHVAAPSLEFDDKDAAVAVMKGAAQDAEFVGAVLLGEDGQRVVASVGDEKMPTAAKVAFPSEPVTAYVGDILEVTVPVASKGGARGILVVGFSTQRIAAGTLAARRTTLAISAIILLAGFGIAFALGRSLSVRLDALVHAAERVARGDLTSAHLPQASDDDIGRMAGAFARMLSSQRQLVRQIAGTAEKLSSAAGQFSRNAGEQERGASAQTNAVSEARRTMGVLLEQARQIAKTAADVLENAEHAHQNSQVVAERINALSAHTQRIAEILEVIKDIANKSDLLALNAALEGTKAGEAGKGFSLVAGQMQRLAENVMGAVKDIKELTTTISGATQATVVATDESTRLAGDTTRSARQIARVIGEQQAGTEQVNGAMELVSNIAAQSASGSKEIVSSTTDLRALTQRLEELVGAFRLDAADNNNNDNGESSSRPTLSSEISRPIGPAPGGTYADGPRPLGDTPRPPRAVAKVGTT